MGLRLTPGTVTTSLGSPPLGWVQRVYLREVPTELSFPVPTPGSHDTKEPGSQAGRQESREARKAGKPGRREARKAESQEGGKARKAGWWDGWDMPCMPPCG